MLCAIAQTETHLSHDRLSVAGRVWDPTSRPGATRAYRSSASGPEHPIVVPADLRRTRRQQSVPRKPSTCGSGGSRTAANDRVACNIGAPGKHCACRARPRSARRRRARFPRIAGSRPPATRCLWETGSRARVGVPQAPRRPRAPPPLRRPRRDRPPRNTAHAEKLRSHPALIIGRYRDVLAANPLATLLNPALTAGGPMNGVRSRALGHIGPHICAPLTIASIAAGRGARDWIGTSASSFDGIEDDSCELCPSGPVWTARGDAR